MNMTRWHRYNIAVALVAALLLLSITGGVRDARGYSAVETLNLNTHGLMLREAYSQLSVHPAFKNSRFLPIDRITKSEGVFKDIPWNPFPTQGGGPDVDGRSKYGDHYYNPRTKQGGAPAAVGKYFSILVNSMLTKHDAGAEQGAAWSAHFLADMCLPHHIVGMPAGQAEAIYIGGIDGRSPWNLTPEESGPLWLGTTPFAKSTAWNLFLGDLYSKWPEWGTTQDFKRTIEAFHSLGGGGEAGFRDWFDPWYYNGLGLGIDPFQPIGPIVHNSSHAKWEVWAHLELTRGSTPYKATVNERFHPQWENAWLSFNEQVPWRAQQKQAEEFAKKAAQQTYDDMEKIFKNPRYGVDDAIWRIMTLWRASMTAMSVSLETKEDPSNPARYQVRAIVHNGEKENVFDVKVRLTLTGDGSTFQETKDAKGGTSTPEPGSADFFVQPRDPKTCKVRVEVIGHYEKTPDLQYAVTEQPFQGIKKSQDDAQNTQLKDIIDALKRAAQKAEELASSITADCSSIKTELAGLNGEIDKLKTAIESREKKIRSLTLIAEDLKTRAESIRQCHLDAEQGATNEGQIAHNAENYSKALCEATKAIQGAKTKDERRQLFAGLQSTQADLRAFLSEGNSILERMRQGTRKAQNALNDLERSLSGLNEGTEASVREPPQEDINNKLSKIKDRIRSAQQKLNEIVRVKDDAAASHEMGRKIVASLETTPDTEKEKLYREMEQYVSRVDRARENAGDCPGQCQNAADELAQAAAPVIDADTKSREALKRARGDVLPGDIKKARDTAGMVKYLEQMAAAYMERIRKACTDGALCFTLAEDIMKRPIYTVMPDVRGMHIDTAERTLRSGNFRPNTSIIGAAAKMDQEFKVQSQSPAAGARVEEESAVTVYYYGQFSTRDAVANANCTRWPGSVASWDAARKLAVCVCPPGTSWTRNRSSCMDNRQLAVNSLNCSRYPGSVAVFDNRTNRAVCECTQPLRWNRNHTRCVDAEAAAMETADCSRFPGTRPVFLRDQGRVDCFCPQGAMWDAAKNRCISRQEFDNYCNQVGASLAAAARANNLEQFRQILPMARNCDFYNQALADLQAMEHNRQVAIANQMGHNLGTIIGGTNKPPQPPPVSPVKPPGTGTASPVKPPPTVSPVKPPGTGTATPVKPPSTGSRSSVDCEKKFCPICGIDNIDLITKSTSQQCNDCRTRFATQIADCYRGGASASTPNATIAQFKNHVVLQCVQQKWNLGTRSYTTSTVYAVYGPGKPYPSGNCKQVGTPDTESQCSIRAQSLASPRR
jgi:hypothetical protein